MSVDWTKRMFTPEIQARKKRNQRSVGAERTRIFKLIAPVDGGE
jgi:hypothetical protein